MDKKESLEFAEKFLSDIISFFGENIYVSGEIVENDIISLKVDDSGINSILIGRNAETLRSFQYIISTALRNKNAEIYRVNVDIADYKKQREEKIADKARGWIEKVIETGEDFSARLNAADRRIVHKTAQEFDGIETHSEGEGRDRRIIISKA